MNTDISPKFPFESKFIEINGSNMHYIDVGEGETILFLHGQPTSSYLWRNIIPHLQTAGRCIAPDLIGMGKSDKPDIAYTYEDHYDYVVKFIKKLELSVTSANSLTVNTLANSESLCNTSVVSFNALLPIPRLFRTILPHGVHIV